MGISFSVLLTLTLQNTDSLVSHYFFLFFTCKFLWNLILSKGFCKATSIYITEFNDCQNLDVKRSSDTFIFNYIWEQTRWKLSIRDWWQRFWFYGIMPDFHIDHNYVTLKKGPTSYSLILIQLTGRSATSCGYLLSDKHNICLIVLLPCYSVS